MTPNQAEIFAYLAILLAFAVLPFAAVWVGRVKP